MYQIFPEKDISTWFEENTELTIQFSESMKPMQNFEVVIGNRNGPN